MAYQKPIPEKQSRGMFGDALKQYVQVEKVAQIAFILPCAVLIGWLGGAWLDGKLHTNWIGVVGFVVGCAAGMSTVIRMAIQLVADPKKKPGEAGRTAQDGEERR